MFTFRLEGSEKDVFLLFDSKGNNIKFNVSRLDYLKHESCYENVYENVAEIADGEYILIQRYYKVEKISRIVIKESKLWDNWEFIYEVDKNLELTLLDFLKDRTPENSKKVLCAIHDYMNMSIGLDTQKAREHHLDWLWSKFDAAETVEEFEEVQDEAGDTGISTILEAAINAIEEIDPCRYAYVYEE